MHLPALLQALFLLWLLRLSALAAEDELLVPLFGNDPGLAEFHRRMKAVLSGNAFTHSTLNPGYWNIFFIATVTGAPTCGLKSTQGKEYFHASHTVKSTSDPSQKDVTLLAQRTGNKVAYRGIYVIGKRPTTESQKKEAKANEVKARELLKGEVRAHLNRGKQRPEFDNFFFIKIHLARETTAGAGSAEREVTIEQIAKKDIGQVYRGLTPNLEAVVAGANDGELTANHFTQLPDELKRLRTSGLQIGTDESTTIHRVLGAITEEDPKTAAVGMSKALAIIGNMYRRVEDTPAAGKSIPEYRSHGFIHGILESLYKERHDLTIRVEMRGGLGWIDLLVRVKQHPIIVEIKRPAKAGAGATRDDLAIGYAQIGRNHYTQIVPYITLKRQVVLMAVAFNENVANRVKTGVETVKVEFSNFLDSTIKLSRVFANAPTAPAHAQAVEDAKKAVAKVLQTSPDAEDIRNLNRMIIGIMSAKSQQEASQKYYFERRWSVTLETTVKNEMMAFIVDPVEGPLLKLAFVVHRDPASKQTDTLEARMNELKITPKDRVTIGQKEELRLVSIFQETADEIWLPSIDVEGGGTLNAKMEEKPNRMIVSIEVVLNPLADGERRSFLKDVNIKARSVSDLRYFSVDEVGGTSGRIAAEIDVKQLIGSMASEKESRRRTNTEVRGEIERVFAGEMRKLIRSEKHFQAVMDGLLRTQDKHLVLTEQSLGSGRADLVLINANNRKARPYVLELKFYANTAPRSDGNKLEAAYAQVEKYVPHLGPMSRANTAECLAIAYFARKNTMVAIGVWSGPVQICNPLLQAQLNQGLGQPPKQQQKKKQRRFSSISTLGCWENIRSSTSLRSIKARLQEGGVALDRESFIAYYRIAPVERRLALTSAYRELEHLHTPLYELQSSPCAGKLPGQCFDQFALSPLNQQRKESLVQGIAGEVARLKPVVHRLRQSLPTLRQADRAFFVFDALDHIYVSIKEDKLGELAKDGALIGAYSSTSMVANVLDKYRFEIRIVTELTTLQLVGRFGVADEVVAHRIASDIYRATRMVPKVLRLFPVAASAVGVWSTTQEIVDLMKSEEWEHMGSVMRVSHVVVKSCKVVSGIGCIAAVVTGLVAAEPVLVIVYFTCDVTDRGLTYVSNVNLISTHVEITRWEKYTSWVPIVNHREQLQRDMVANQVHAQTVNASLFPGHYDGCGIALYDIVFDGEHVKNLSPPTTADILVVGSLRNASLYTRAPSRTLVKLAQNGLVLVCSPTAPDLVEGHDKKFSVPNLKETKPSASFHYCGYAAVLVNTTTRRFKEAKHALKILYDLPTLSPIHSAITVGVEDDNHIVAHEGLRIKAGAHKNTLILPRNGSFDPEKITLESRAYNVLLLGCSDFSLALAASVTGGKVSALVGAMGCSNQNIVAGKNTSLIYTGGPDTTLVELSLCDVPYINIEAFPRNTIDATAYAHNRVSVVAFDLPSGNDSQAMPAMGPLEILLPARDDYDPERHFHLTLISQNILADIDRYRLFTFGRVYDTFTVYKNGSAFCRVRSQKPINRLVLGLNFHLQYTVLFDPHELDSPTPRYVGIDHRLAPEDGGLPLLRQFLGELANSPALHNANIRVQSGDFVLVVDNLRLEHGVFVTSNASEIELIKLSSRTNVVVVEHCCSLELVFDAQSSLLTHIDVAAVMDEEGANEPDVSKDDAGRVTIAYECRQPTAANRSSRTIQLYPMASSQPTEPPIQRRLTLRTRQGDYDMEFAFDDAPSRLRATGATHGRTEVVRFHDADQLRSSFSAPNRLNELDRLVLTDIPVAGDVVPLRSGNLLLLFEKRQQGMYALPNYFNETSTAEHDVGVLFVHDGKTTTLRELAAAATDLQQYTIDGWRDLLKGQLRDGYLELLTLDEDLQLHLADVDKLLLLVHDSDPSDTEISISSSGGSGDSAVLEIHLNEIHISIHGWETSNRRPLFCLGQTIVDIGDFGIGEVGKMLATLETLGARQQENGQSTLEE